MFNASDRLYRGKRIDIGKWEYGYHVYNKHENRHYIVNFLYNPTASWCYVDSRTVSRCTGKQVKNGKVFEYDICEDKNGKFIVIWDDDKAAYLMKYLDNSKDTAYPEDISDDSKVIGNLFDNPELMLSLIA
jgi:hypothetical protein